MTWNDYRFRQPPPEKPRESAVDHLTALGLSTYAARTFVALTEIDGGTALEVSESADVPRTRVYDAATELREWDLVEIENASPRRFRPVAPETAGLILQAAYDEHIAGAVCSLETLSEAGVDCPDVDVWALKGRDRIADCVADRIDAARDRVVFASSVAALDEPVVESLERATERGVRVEAPGTAEQVVDRLERRLGEVRTPDVEWAWSGSSAGRLVLVDGTDLFLSGFSERPRDAVVEVGVWARGTETAIVDLLESHLP